MTPHSKIKARQARRDFARLAAQTDEQLGCGDALARAAMLIAAEEQANAPFEVEGALGALEQMAAEVRRRLAEIGPGGATEPHEILNHFLFEEMGFAGDQEDYYDPRNSLLNLVLERRRGIPITLSLVYMEVGRRAGLSVEGVGMPGHFIARVLTPARPRGVLVDSFNNQVIDEEDCQERLDNSYGGQVPLSPEHLRAATPREILVRMLTNLKANYLRRNLPREALAASERILLLNPRSLIEHRDRGLLLSRLGRPGEALAELKLYLRSAAETDPERAQVREALKAVHLKIASLN